MLLLVSGIKKYSWTYSKKPMDAIIHWWFFKDVMQLLEIRLESMYRAAVRTLSEVGVQPPAVNIHPLHSVQCSSLELPQPIVFTEKPRRERRKQRHFERIFLARIKQFVKLWKPHQVLTCESRCLVLPFTIEVKSSYEHWL